MKPTLYLLIAALLAALPAWAQWPTSPDERLVVSSGLRSEIVSDGANGAFVVIKCSGGGYLSDCYVQRIDQDGYLQYPVPLHLDCGTGEVVFDFHVVTDGEGGAIIGVMEDCYQGGEWYGRLSVYHLDANGDTIYWNVSSNASGRIAEQEYFVMKADSMGGAYMAYGDISDCRIQRFGPQGERLMGDEGTPFYPEGIAYPAPYDLTMDADRIASYISCRGDTLRGYKFLPDGTALWGSSGVIIPDLGYFTQMALDGTGGFVEIYRKYMGGINPYRLYANRIDSQGTAIWGPGGIFLAEINWYKDIQCHYPYAYIGWTPDTLNYGPSKLQKLDYQGNIQWPEPKDIFSTTGFQGEVVMADANGTGLLFFTRQSLTGLPPYRLYAQKMDYDGIRLWPEEGVQINANQSVFYLRLDSNGSGGGIYTWMEIDPTYGQLICAALVNTWGELGVVGIFPQNNPKPLPQQFITLFPNPVNSQSKLQLPAAISPGEYFQIRLCNVQGQVVFSMGRRHDGPIIPMGTIWPGWPDLPSSIYWLNVQTARESWYARFIYLK